MLKKIYSVISPFHFFLLIPFHILHTVNFYYGLIPEQFVLSSLYGYLALAISIFLFSKVIFKNNLKAGIYSFIVMGYFFGFGVVKDLMDNSPSLSRISSYKYLLPAIAIMLLLLLVYLKKTVRNFTRLNNFLFLAVTLNLLFEIFVFSKNVITGAEKENDLGDPNLSMAASFKPCSNCEQPDIYYMIFDEYTSSDCLKRYFNYSNEKLDNYLTLNNFFISKKSRSNYSFTSFSMASILDMDYLNLSPNYTEAIARDIARGEYTIKNNNTIKIFEKQGYKIHNHSLFDFADYPSLLGTYFYELRRMFISDETLLARVKRDIGWNLIRLRTRQEAEKRMKEKFYQSSDFVIKNKITSFNTAFDAIKNDNPLTKDFYYFHFVLPHDPFVFDSSGNVRYDPDNKIRMDIKYIDQVKHANDMIFKLVDMINSKYNKKAVIIIQGDHGFKTWPGKEHYNDIAFENLNAVYLPDTTYKGYYDGISSVNTFRLLFNHYFNSNFEILPDTSVQVFVKPVLKKNYGIRQDGQ